MSKYYAKELISSLISLKNIFIFLVAFIIS